MKQDEDMINRVGDVLHQVLVDNDIWELLMISKKEDVHYLGRE